MKFFRSRTFEDAFRVIEAELNFFYDVLYTKAAVIHYLTGYIFRAISICSVIIAFALFHVLDKHGFHEYDIRITYALLHGAIGLEFVALSMLICSDWTIAFLGRYEEYRIGKTVIEFLVKLKSKSSSMPIFYSRWSKSIFQYNLIDSQLRRLPKWIEKPLHHISLKEFFNDLKSGRQEPYTDELGKLIFDVLIQMSYAVGDSDSIKKMCATRGKWALEKKEDWKDLLSFVSEVDYGESLLLWHIATELCYNKDENTNFYSKTRKKTSKILSDYMLYLMIKQPNMMSTVAGIGQIRFRDTCAEMHKFISEKFFAGSKTMESVCQSLLVVPTDVKPADVKGDRSKSVLFDACILAKELDKFEETKWEIVSEVWVELLVYAAIHCRPYNHAQQLSKGGELLTLIWLLTVHLGLSEQFQIVEGHARAKLLVEK
ncbi:uncharacterized protein LOC120288711 [Eucalyptus grandis]|uniref:uncharacterized protein LOC120288711 n=1 Tax=Eucalyptus grandis TaxID=71139 RepID=UPI00192EDE7C|nr:uncharacterized protein LOC120288711 [Eucalyptus grandis]